MAEEADRGGVTRQPAAALGHSRGPLFDRIEQVPFPLEAMHLEVQAIARRDILLRGRSNGTSRHAGGDRRALHRHKRLADVEAQLRIKRQRAGVIARLQQAN